MEPPTLRQQMLSIIPVIASGQVPENKIVRSFFLVFKTTSLSLFAYILILFFLFFKETVVVSCWIINISFSFANQAQSSFLISFLIGKRCWNVCYYFCDHSCNDFNVIIISFYNLKQNRYNFSSHELKANLGFIWLPFVRC